MKKVIKFVLTSLILLLNIVTYGQSFNNNSKITFLNHNVPKSPESESFEKYGKIPVGELTGVPNIGIPLYTVQGKYINVPISLAYHASGIKVAQEATWVGLGWDLIPGGRITLEIKGGYDNYSDQFLTPENKNVIRYIFGFNSMYTNMTNIFGEPPCIFQFNDLPISFGYTCNIPTNVGFNINDYELALEKIIKEGAAEPDLYHVNVLGKSFTFYKDLFTKEIKFIGEHNNYEILDIGNGFIFTDDNGVSYHFFTQERTLYNTPLNGVLPEVVTSWLLTKIEQPNGEAIFYTYQNFGEETSVPPISESGTVTYSSPILYTTNAFNSIYHTRQKPEYLTKIESKNVIVNFNLDYREDVGGTGARKLASIDVIEKQQNALLNRIVFNYDYFVGDSRDGYFIDPNILYRTSPSGSTALDQVRKRLKINSVNFYGTDPNKVEKSYRFLYENSVNLPNKVSLAQDHWGYFNGANNVKVGSSTPSFTPYIESLVNEGILSSKYASGLKTSSNGMLVSQNNVNITNLIMGHANRRADAYYAKAGMLKTIIYPTGGWTNFEFELHSSYYSPAAPTLSGGGLRVKQLVNFSAAGKLASLTNYSYLTAGGTSGVYMGRLDYIQISNKFGQYAIFHSSPIPGNPYEQKALWEPEITLFSNGNLNIGGAVVNYSEVKTENVDFENQSNTNFTVKKFSVRDPSLAHKRGNYDYLEDHWMYLAPTAERYLDGQLMSEEHYKSNGNLAKSIRNYYSQRNLLDTMYSLRIANNRLTKFPDGAITNLPHYEAPYPLFFYDPARAYHTKLDSSVVTSYEAAGQVISKTENLYNNFNQIERSISKNSDGMSRVLYTTTPLSFTGVLPPLPAGDATGSALAIQNLRVKHMYNLPIEQVEFKRYQNGQDFVVGGVYKVYDEQTNLKQVYRLELADPIPNAQFQKATYGGAAAGYDMTKDTNYKLEYSVDYYPFTNNPRQSNEKGKLNSYIMDNANDNLIATANNALAGNVAFTSFETNETGQWTVNCGTTNSLLAHTGKKSLNVNGSACITGSVATGGAYVVSYWLASGSLSVNGATVPASTTVNGWSFYEHTLSLPDQGAITIGGNAVVDELRLHPKNAQMTSFTYEPLVGLSSQTDPKSNTSYYTYDTFNRLSTIKDHQKNIVKNINYNFIDISSIVPTPVYFNQLKTGAAQKICAPGQTGTYVPYTVPAGKYISTISQAIVDQQALDEFNANVQSNANLLGSCNITPVRPTFSLSYYIAVGQEFNLAVNDPVSGQWEYYVLSGSGSLDNIPGSVSGTISLWEVNYFGNYTYTLDSGATETGNLIYFTDTPLSSSLFISIISSP